MNPTRIRQARQQARAALDHLYSRQQVLRTQVARLPLPTGLVVGSGVLLGVLAGRMRALRAWALGRQAWALWRGFSGSAPR